ncbi:MAG: DNA repair protein RecN [Saprospiraceae bacterium]|nr:DNA repair protein RecN [Saprospiraceae bacterium]
MIKSLHIRNYAIIELLELSFSEGLTIITGETGAGKSILLGALELIMGERADSKALYDESDKCVVEGLFDVKAYDLKEFFESHDIDYDTEVVVRREILPSGKSRAFINDTPVNLKVLQDLSSSLIDLHQQFDTLDIHQISFQLRMIDALAGNKSLLQRYAGAYRKFQADKRRLADLVAKSDNATREMDFLQFQMEEFNRAELVNGEQEALEEELTRLTNAEDIKRVTGSAYNYLVENEQSVVGMLQEMGVQLHQIGKVDHQIALLNVRFDSLVVELQELARELETIAEETEYDAQRISEIQQRLDLVYRLQKKHSVATVAELLAIQENIQSQLGSFGDLSKEIADLTDSINQQEQALTEKAMELRERRRAVIPDFETKVTDLLSQLAMPHAQMQVQFDELSTLGPTGLDEVNFLFAANKGSRLQRIKEVASGGELSRLTLVTKSLVASAIPLPTLIFDEIDSGISGDVALKMGNILRQLSNQHQVVTITHSPQIAAKADAHYFVYKKEKDDRTVTHVRMLTTDERVRAIATMLSQNPPSDSAMENARELLSL